MKNIILSLAIQLNFLLFLYPAFAEEAATGMTVEREIKWDQRFTNASLFFLNSQITETQIGLDVSISPYKIATAALAEQLQRENEEVYNILKDNREETKKVIDDYNALRDQGAINDEGLNQLKTQLKENIGKENQQYSKFIDEIKTTEDLDTAVKYIEAVNEGLEDSQSFAIRPFAKIWLEPVAISLDFPMVGFLKGDQEQFSLGNLSLGASYYIPFGEAVPVSLSLGLGLRVPTAQDEARQLIVTDPISYPLYDKNFLTISPELGFGVDLEVFIIQAVFQANISNSLEDGVESRNFLKYGLASIFSPIDLFNVVFEVINYQGLSGFSDEDNFDVLVMSGGLRLDFLGFKPGFSISGPISRDLDKLDETAKDNLAKYSVLVSLMFGF